MAALHSFEHDSMGETDAFMQQHAEQERTSQREMHDSGVTQIDEEE